MTEKQITQNKNSFLAICKENIKRNGIDSLLEWLCETDFFKAPCSTKYHLSERGGLCQHSLNVYNCLIDLCTSFGISVNDNIETITLISLFHDICKADEYKLELRPIKENNVWTSKMVYVISDECPYGHGEKSVMLLLQHIKLKKDEILSIRWHMGAWDNAVKGGDLSLNTAKNMSKFVTLLQCADSIATNIIEV